MNAEKHNLYEVDLTKNTAFCTVCGQTEIYVRNNRIRTKLQVLCKNKAQEIALHIKERRLARQIEKQSKPGWKPKHKLSDVDITTMTAICAVCGRTDIRKVVRGKYTRYDCLTKIRTYSKKHRRGRYVGRPSNPHALSQVDEEKRTAVCATCGPVQIVIWRGKRKLNRRCVNAKKQAVSGS